MFDLSEAALAAVAAYDTDDFGCFLDEGNAEAARDNRLRAAFLKRLFPGANLPAFVTLDGFDDVIARIPLPR